MNMKLTFGLFITSLLLPLVSQAESAESFVGVKPDKESCNHDNNEFSALPSITEEKAPFIDLYAEDLNQRINKNIGETCQIDGIGIKGRISKETYFTIKLALALIDKRPESKRSLKIWLESPGGVIRDAMNIGRLVSANNMEAMIPFNGGCYSSCVLIYAAASSRWGIGELGIHRPFSYEVSTKEITHEEYLSHYEVISEEMRTYLASYGVSPGLVDEMNVIPSDDIKLIELGQRDKYGLGIENIAFVEYDKAKTIELCGRDYYEQHLAHSQYLKSCRERLQVTGFDSDAPCWEEAKTAFPEYRQDFQGCQVKKHERFQGR
ncbi:hypothetical protein [Methylophaga sp. OBS3]|uniref:hypothetical protein n=1 Tax=Methylophaga sp. OBS3 TaxID=2991934 RepID=UPI00224FD5C3|nr:hypothetical protein [Methylophaga sp. OBS3]MCX4190806.1 hypothetical protein [Methylophaga sp. OBS3]